MHSWALSTLALFQQYGAAGLFILSFVEASFFPLPPYLLLVPMILARPMLGPLYTFMAVAGSVTGGLLGYVIGFRVGRPVLVHLMKPAAMRGLESTFDRYGGWAIFAGGLTPIPYKVFCISAGAFGVPLQTFVVASVAARTVHFGAALLLALFFGPEILRYSRHFNLSQMAVLTAAVFGLLVLWRNSSARRFLQRVWKVWREAFHTSTWLRRLYAGTIGYFGWTVASGAALTAFALLMFAKLARELLESELAGFDRAAARLAESLTAGWLSTLMRTLSDLGSPLMVALVVAAAALVLAFGRRSRWYDGLSLAICLVGALGLTAVLKTAFQRPRPPLPWLAPAQGYSFPSGHSLVTLALFGFMSYLVLRDAKTTGRRVLGGVLLVLPLLVGLSRVYLRVHYASDVLAGWLVAAGWVGTCIVGRVALSRRRTFRQTWTETDPER